MSGRRQQNSRLRALIMREKGNRIIVGIAPELGVHYYARNFNAF
jgi:hypothetical protein